MKLKKIISTVLITSVLITSNLTVLATDVQMSTFGNMDSLGSTVDTTMSTMDVNNLASTFDNGINDLNTMAIMNEVPEIAKFEQPQELPKPNPQNQIQVQGVLVRDEQYLYLVGGESTYIITGNDPYLYELLLLLSDRDFSVELHLIVHDNGTYEVYDVIYLENIPEEIQEQVQDIYNRAALARQNQEQNQPQNQPSGQNLNIPTNLSIPTNGNIVNDFISSNQGLNSDLSNIFSNFNTTNGTDGTGNSLSNFDFSNIQFPTFEGFGGSSGNNMTFPSFEELSSQFGLNSDNSISFGSFDMSSFGELGSEFSGFDMSSFGELGSGFSGFDMSSFGELGSGFSGFDMSSFGELGSGFSGFDMSNFSDTFNFSIGSFENLLGNDSGSGFSFADFDMSAFDNFNIGSETGNEN